VHLVLLLHPPSWASTSPAWVRPQQMHVLVCCNWIDDLEGSWQKTAGVSCFLCEHGSIATVTIYVLGWCWCRDYQDLL